MFVDRLLCASEAVGDVSKAGIEVILHHARRLYAAIPVLFENSQENRGESNAFSQRGNLLVRHYVCMDRGTFCKVLEVEPLDQQRSLFAQKLVLLVWPLGFPLG